jgi:Flp pilus assembly pilin Flp
VRGLWRRLWRDQGGQTTAEYMLLLAVIVCQVIFVYFMLAPALRDGFVELAGRILRMKP